MEGYWKGSFAMRLYLPLPPFVRAPQPRRRLASFESSTCVVSLHG